MCRSLNGMEICFRLAQNPYAVCTVVSLNLKCTPASRCMQNPNGKPMPAWWQRTLSQVAPYAGTAVNANIPVGPTTTTMADLRITQFGCATQTAKEALRETIRIFHVGMNVMLGAWGRLYWKSRFVARNPWEGTNWHHHLHGGGTL